MPRKRTRSKRHNLEAQRFTWESVFDCGRDFFGELPELGVATDKYGRPDPDEAREAWQRLGPDYLASHPREKSPGIQIWALEQFGEPDAR